MDTNEHELALDRGLKAASKLPDHSSSKEPNPGSSGVQQKQSPINFKPMTVTPNSGNLKKFRRTPWRFQQTVEIPQGSVAHAEFASAIVTSHPEINEATVIIDEVVFDTEQLTALCPTNAALPLTRDSSISATGCEVTTLLAAAFSDGPDFIFIPNPKPFICYADHDQWITFYSNTRSQLNQITEPLASRGYKLVKDWQREF